MSWGDLRDNRSPEGRQHAKQGHGLKTGDFAIKRSMVGHATRFKSGAHEHDPWRKAIIDKNLKNNIFGE
jgi:hypothetical protein